MRGGCEKPSAMPPDATPSSRSARPWYATDSGRAGVALSAVTLAVLAIGVAVIQGARSDDAVEPTPASRKGAAAATPAPVVSVNREEWIVLKGSAPAPTQLPAPQQEAPDPTLPFTAERAAEGVLERR